MDQYTQSNVGSTYNSVFFTDNISIIVIKIYKVTLKLSFLSINPQPHRHRQF